MPLRQRATPRWPEARAPPPPASAADRRGNGEIAGAWPAVTGAVHSEPARGRITANVTAGDRPERREAWVPRAVARVTRAALPAAGTARRTCAGVRGHRRGGRASSSRRPPRRATCSRPGGRSGAPWHAQAAASRRGTRSVPRFMKRPAMGTLIDIASSGGARGGSVPRVIPALPSCPLVPRLGGCTTKQAATRSLTLPPVGRASGAGLAPGRPHYPAGSADVSKRLAARLDGHRRRPSGYQPH